MREREREEREREERERERGRERGEREGERETYVEGMMVLVARLLLLVLGYSATVVEASGSSSHTDV